MSGIISPPNDEGKARYYNQPDKYGNKAIREMFADGEVAVTDIDLIVRSGFDGDKDYVGRFKILDWKAGSGTVGRGQQITYAEIDRMLRVANHEDKKAGMPQRYDGLYIVWTPTMSLDVPTLKVNGQEVTMYQFKQFLLNRYNIAPLRFGYDWPPYSER